MNGIENILSYIKSESDAENEAIEREAIGECERIRQRYARMEREEYHKRIMDGISEAERRLERLNNLAVLESKKQVLRTQQEMIAGAFEYAANEFKQLPKDEYIAFLARCACEASLTGTESIILSPDDKESIGGQVLSEANSALSRAGKIASLILSEETANISGGLILSDGNTEADCSIESLMAEARVKLSPAVASILFD